MAKQELQVCPRVPVTSMGLRDGSVLVSGTRRRVRPLKLDSPKRKGWLEATPWELLFVA